MKRSFYILILFIATAFAVSSCSLETDNVPGDGDMEGMWHLVSIEYLNVDGAGKDSVADMSGERVFWSFQHKLLQLKDYDGGRQTMLCRFDIADGKLTLHDFYINARSHDNLTTDMTKLTPYGLTSLTPTFSYHISGGKLTLEADGEVMRFKRF